jgi:malate dehydrogenase (oxaloacetate-decarboxylating)
MDKNVYQEALELHEKLRGKIETTSKIKLDNKSAMSLAYTPGVAEVSRQIANNPASARKYTIKGNTVAIVTDGSAVLGLGNVGPLAALPVMEGKAAIFKEFAGVNAVPICLDTQDTEEIISIVKNLSPTFGGINLEDISAPRCFEIEKRLREELDIPVMHDDQWGTATVILAAMVNALKLADKDMADVRVVMNGVGSAGVATARLLMDYGIKNITFCDSKGIIHDARIDLTTEKAALLESSSAQPSAGGLKEAVIGADVFIGVSLPNLLTKDMVKSMAEKPIIFALSNPSPEIMPDDAFEAGAYIVATGRSDFPNQVNNSLIFPGLFKGMLDNDIKQFQIGMFSKVAVAVAGLVDDLTPSAILPNMFDPRLVSEISSIVSKLKS